MVHAQAKGNKPKILIVQVLSKKYYFKVGGREGVFAGISQGPCRGDNPTNPIFSG